MEIVLKEPDWAKQIQPTTQKLLCSELMVSLSTEKDIVIRHQLNYVVAFIGGQLYPKGEWKELVPYLYVNFKTQTSNKKRSLLVLLRDLIFCLHHPAPVLFVHLRDILMAGFADLDINVRYTAFLSGCQYITKMNGRLPGFLCEDLIPHIYKTAKEVLKTSNEYRVQRTIDWMWKLAMEWDYFCPEYFDNDFLISLLRIALTASDRNTKILCFEFMLLLHEAQDDLLSCIPEWSGECVKFALHMLADIDDVSDEWWTRNNLNENQVGEVYTLQGEVLLDRAAQCCKSAFNLLGPIAMSWVNQRGWKKKFAAVQCVGIMAEASDQSHMHSLVRFVLPFTKDPNPRIRWASIFSIALIADTFKILFQESYCKEVMPLLMRMVDEDPNQRIREQAADALVNVLSPEEPGEEFVAPYLQDLVSLLCRHLRDNRSAISTLEVLEPYFAREENATLASDLLRDLLAELQFIGSPTDCTARDAWGRTIRCLSAIGVRSGKNVDWEKFMEILIGTPITAEEDLNRYLILAHDNVSNILLKDYAKYLPQVVPGLLHVLVDGLLKKVTSEDGEEKYVFLGVSQMEEANPLNEDMVLKEETFRVLANILDNCKERFFDFLEPVSKIAFPFLSDGVGDQMRGYAAGCIASLVSCYVKHAKKIDPSTKEAMADFARKSFSAIVKEILQENDMTVNLLFLFALGQIVETVKGGVLREVEMLAIGRVCAQQLKYYDILGPKPKKKKKQKKKKQKEGEEEEEEEEEVEQRKVHLEFIFNFLGETIKNNPGFLHIFQPFFTFVLEFLKPEKTEAEITAALCLIDDVVEGGGKQTTSLFPTIMPAYTAGVISNVPGIRQAAAYGIGIFAHVGQEDFFPYVKDFIESLRHVCQLPDAREEEYVYATTNVISALGWIYKTYPTQLDLPKLLPEWLHFLPMHDDDDEGKIIYSNLCDFVEHPVGRHVILGANYENLPKLIEIAEDVWESKVSKKVRERLKKVTEDLVATVGPLPKTKTKVKAKKGSKKK
eukprot:Phypoly_transcript_01525.p1 GENE.Phypoly_transcript_01525~~Phypoly_transcript_01525.p1  ORF type:complete len:1093 (+),score=207.75 Phypoly_transcript_01525:256-3279(+)